MGQIFGSQTSRRWLMTDPISNWSKMPFNHWRSVENRVGSRQSIWRQKICRIEVAQALNGAFLKVKRTLISTRSLLVPHAPLPRQGIPQNGIRLCQNCAKLVDNDSHRYTVELLQEWKQRAEAAALNGLKASLLTKVPSRKTLQTLRSPTEKSGYRKNATTICLKSW